MTLREGPPPGLALFCDVMAVLIILAYVAMCIGLIVSA